MDKMLSIDTYFIYILSQIKTRTNLKTHMYFMCLDQILSMDKIFYPWIKILYSWINYFIYG